MHPGKGCKSLWIAEPILEGALSVAWPVKSLYFQAYPPGSLGLCSANLGEGLSQVEPFYVMNLRAVGVKGPGGEM